VRVGRWGAPALDRDGVAWRGQLAEPGQQGAAVCLQLGLELGGDGEAGRGRARLGDLVGGEDPGGAGVDPLRVGPQGQDQEHVGEVDGLAPGGGADLEAGDVDQLEVAVLDE
jgi:hypothetical protein